MAEGGVAVSSTLRVNARLDDLTLERQRQRCGHSDGGAMTALKP